VEISPQENSSGTQPFSSKKAISITNSQDFTLKLNRDKIVDEDLSAYNVSLKKKQM